MDSLPTFSSLPSMKLATVNVEVDTTQLIRFASAAIVVLFIVSKIFFGPKKLGKALPTPGGKTQRIHSPDYTVTDSS